MADELVAVLSLAERLASIREREVALRERELAMQERQGQQQGPHLKRPAYQPHRREQRIINAIGTGRMTGEAIARALHVSFAHSFQDVLALMTRFGVLTNKGQGYEVSPRYAHLIQDDEAEDEPVEDVE